MDKVQKIREEVEKLKKLADAMYYAAQYLTTDASRLHKAMNEYHQFIITEYPKEEPVSENLEEAANMYAECEYNHKNFNILPDRCRGCSAPLRYAFKAGANWQKKQDQSIIELAEDHAMLAGMEKKKEQMMARAVEGIARPDDNEIWCDLDSFNLKDGDKCRVIVIKED